MTPADWIELMTGSQGNTIASFAILLTMLSGYTIVAYTVGGKLTRWQLSIISTLYVVGSLITLGGMRESMRAATRARVYLSNMVEEINYPLDLERMLRIADLVITVDAILVLAPLLFMWQVRHPTNKRPV